MIVPERTYGSSHLALCHWGPLQAGASRVLLWLCWGQYGPRCREYISPRRAQALDYRAQIRRFPPTPNWGSTFWMGRRINLSRKPTKDPLLQIQPQLLPGLSRVQQHLPAHNLPLSQHPFLPLPPHRQMKPAGEWQLLRCLSTRARSSPVDFPRAAGEQTAAKAEKRRERKAVSQGTPGEDHALGVL